MCGLTVFPFSACLCQERSMTSAYTHDVPRRQYVCVLCALQFQAISHSACSMSTVPLPLSSHTHIHIVRRFGRVCKVRLVASLLCPFLFLFFDLFAIATATVAVIPLPQLRCDTPCALRSLCVIHTKYKVNVFWRFNPYGEI